MRLYRPRLDTTIRPFDIGELQARLAGFRGEGDHAYRLLTAVSGGPDSLGLLLLASRLPTQRFEVFAATVDHGLRPAARDEAARVSRICRQLDIPHATLRWSGFDGRGNLQASARDARYRLLADEADRVGAVGILTAHHAGDQLETVLHALGRRDHETRLAGMRAKRDLAPGLALIRPFLDAAPERLHAVIALHGIEAIQDPSNEDETFARVRNRRAIAEMPAEERANLEALHQRAARNRDAADRSLAKAVRRLLDRGDLSFDIAGNAQLSITAFRALPDDLAISVLSRMLTVVGGADHAPDRNGVEPIAAALRRSAMANPESLRPDERAIATLGGARVSLDGATIEFIREFGRRGPPTVLEPWTRSRIVFDNRFDIVVSERERRVAEDEGAALAGYGTTGRGNLVLRPLPVLVSPAGAILATHPALVSHMKVRREPVPSFEAITSRVRWRVLRDLGLT